ncbi:Flp pilus assembly protein TadB [Candidatus Hydrogenisulfobacillus filiaventi]|uniref:Flp pilus assembly protein TadB n=1 Tax=Candidatus Hydrogenisulfobacillus filiaventi TaxID=2707344 RepID=A0A6F8ZDQ0_9FIRM|nr:type II secretion system F family protein [Bacillota bacterium]CAB1127887.1 Flp pilus assembly protein TadB [Candidatus Hydrogenisulfobacillus filiaventi]
MSWRILVPLLWAAALPAAWVAAADWRLRRRLWRVLGEEREPGPVAPWRLHWQAFETRWRQSPRAAALQLKPQEYYGLLAAAVGVPGLAGALWRGPLGALVLGLVGGLATLSWFRYRQAQWLAAATAALPALFRSLSAALRAGSNITQGLALVAAQTPEPLRTEVQRALKRLAVGYDFDAVLEELSRRIPSRDLELAVLAITVQREVGGSLADILDHLVTTIEERQQLQREVRALTAQGRFSGWVLAALPPLVAGAIILLNPGYLTPMLHRLSGWAALAYAAVSLVVGMVVIRMLVDGAARGV